MDRRKVQIEKQSDDIIEENNLLQSNLKKIMDEVRTCVDLVKSSRRLTQKDCCLILNYELLVRQKLIEFNYALECALDESPFNQLKTTNLFEEYSSIAMKALEPKTESTLIAQTEDTLIVQLTELPQEPEVSETREKFENVSYVLEKQKVVKLDSDFSNVACASAPSEFNWIENHEPEIETESTFSDADVQNLRDTLKKCSEKLGLNNECLSTMTDFYQKSSNCDKKCSSEIVQNGIDGTNLDLQSDVGSNALKENLSDILQSATCSNSDVVRLPKSTPFNAICNAIPKQEKIYTAEDYSSTDASYKNGTESSSSQEYATDEASNCLIPLVNEDSIVVGSIIDEGQPKTDNNPKTTDDTATRYTAIEKLNNKNVFNREAEAVAKMLPAHKPDISLKPTEHRINNVLEPNDKQPKKKKNKKNRSKENEFYELVPKSTPNTGMQCAFSHVESPNEFYIHLLDEDAVQIDKLTELLNERLSKTQCEFNSKEDAACAIGTFCFSYAAAHKSWYRAQVLDWELENKSENVVVQYVDYGDKQRTSFKNLRRMTQEMTEIPMLAVRCHLALMYPPNSTFTNRLREWPVATIDAMMDLSGLMVQENGEREKLFRIVYASQEGNSVSIDLHNLQDDEEHTVGQVLLDLGLAVQIIDEDHEEPDHEELQVFLQDVDSLERADNINEAVMGYDPRDEARICPFTKSDGTCFKGKNCKLEHVPLSKDGFTTDRILVFKEAMYSLSLPGKGKLVSILITSFKDVCNFFVQIVWKPHKQKGYLMDEDLYSLLADMNQPKTVRTYETFKVYPAIGEIVVVKHWSEKWLRAVVRELFVGPDEQSLVCQVFTLDFGECLRVPLSNLRKIKPHYLELPFQAVECYIHNYVAKEDCDRKKAKTFFLENLYYRNFVAHTMSTSLPLKVSMTTFDGRDIGRKLAEEGFAEEKLCDNNPADDYELEVY